MNILRRKSTISIPSALRTKIERTLGVPLDEHGEADLGLSWQTVAEAQGHLDRIKQMQDALRGIKKDVDAAMKEVRSDFTERRGKVDKHPVSTVAKLVGARSFAAQTKASRRERLVQKKDETLAPYKLARRVVDCQLIELDRLKAQLEAWISKNE